MLDEAYNNSKTTFGFDGWRGQISQYALAKMNQENIYKKSVTYD